MKRRYGYPPPKKSLGQVMLVDGLIAREIIDSLDLTSNRKVLEIGPGRGILTDYLILKNADVICCEIDERMAALLKNRFGGKSNFNLIIQQD